VGQKMTDYPLHLVRTGPQTAACKPKHPLGDLQADRVAKHLVLYRPREQDIDAVVDRGRATIPGMTDTAVARKVIAHNCDCLWAIARRRSFRPESPVGEGFIAMLPLNAAGLSQLAANIFDARNPDLNLIAPRGERPAGIYIWATYAPGTLAAAVALFMKEMSAAPYKGVNLYTRPNTVDGRRFNEALGLKKGAKIGPVFAPHLYVFQRADHKTPLYDSHHPNVGRQELTVSVARSLDDLMRVMSVRTAVYVAEQDCPYDEEFDGNDLLGTHLIGFVGGEPAGCLRIRFFADFAKLERVAIRKEFRNTRLAFQLIRAGIDLCRMKGYHRLYGHARKSLIGFWRHFGFELLTGGHELVFSDFDYVEMVAELEPHPHAIAIGMDPGVINRPEGRWHVPGVLEASASRNPNHLPIEERCA